VLVLHGSETKRLFAASARAVTDRVPNARMQEIPGAGHAGPLTHPEAVAEALTEFFSSALGEGLSRSRLRPRRIAT